MPGTFLRRFFVSVVTRIAAVLLVAAIAMILVRFAPGFETDDRDLDPALGAATRAQIHEQRLAEGKLAAYTRNLLTGILHGDLGTSTALGMPIRELIAERGPATLHILLSGIALAWIAGLAWSFGLVLFQAPALAGFSVFTNACLLCLPTAAVAALLLNSDWPAATVLALALLPRVFQVTRGLISQAMEHSTVLAGRARGLRTAHLLGYYVLPRIAGPMLAWLAATVGLAVGAEVPIEVICDVPGLGQLAWKAALARDLPVLLVLTLLVAMLIQLSSSASTLLSEGLPQHQSGLAS